VSDAMKWQVDARNRDDNPLAPEDLYKEGARLLGSSGATTAVALLAVAGLRPVPLGDDLRTSAGPLSTFAEIHRHYPGRHHDGVGVALGEHAGGVVLVAQKATAAAWRRWQAAEGVEVARKVDYGTATEEVSLLPMPRFISLTWQPPPSPLRSTGVHVGQQAIAAAGRVLGRDSKPGEPGWALFTASPVDGVPLVFRDRRADSFGVSVVASGVVPLHARRPSGSTLTASGVPQAEDMPTWLVAALGGRLGKRVAA